LFRPQARMTTDLLSLHDLSDLDSLLEPWTQLLPAAGGTVFHTPGWVLANLESFPPMRADVLVTREQGSVVGIAPIAVRRGRRDLTARTWGELASLPHADYGSVLATPDSSPAVAGGVVEYLEQRHDVAALHLGHLLPDGAFTREVPEVASRRGHRALTQPAYVVRRVPLAEASVADRPSLNKRERQFTRKGNVEFRAFTETHDILDRLDGFFALHARRFEEKGAKSPLRAPSMRRFYAAIVTRLAPTGSVILSTLSLDGSPIATRFSLRFGGTLHLYAAAFEPAFSRYSPGILQLRHLIQHASDTGSDTLDLGIGDSQHKQLFSGGSTTQLVNLQVFRTRRHSAEAIGAGWLRSVSGQHPNVAKAMSRMRRVLPARQPE
jgi:CelD/BcsL family acetyltransferase involved in cellulose biosynthesis